MLARRLVGGGGEVLIAATAATAAGQHDALVGTLKVVDQFAGGFVINDGAHRDFQNNVRTFAASTVGAFAVAAALRLMFRIEAKMDERVVALTGLKNHVPAVAAVTAGRATAWNELLPAKSHATIAAVAGFHPDPGLIDKHACEIVFLAQRNRATLSVTPAKIFNGLWPWQGGSSIDRGCGSFKFRNWNQLFLAVWRLHAALGPSPRARRPVAVSFGFADARGRLR